MLEVSTKDGAVVSALEETVTVGRVSVEPIVRERSASQAYRGAAVARDRRIRIDDRVSSGFRAHWLAFVSVPFAAFLVGMGYAVGLLPMLACGVLGSAVLYWASRWHRHVRRHRIDLVDDMLVLTGGRHDLAEVVELGVGRDPKGARSVWIRVADDGREQVVDALTADEAELVQTTIAEAVERARRA